MKARRTTIKVGLDVLTENPLRSKSWGRCALLLNQASVDASLRPSQVILGKALKGRLVHLFTPQHGLCADKQDNMIESGHGRDIVSGLPFYSLYSEVREPNDEMLNGIDTVIADVQDVGTRVYTFLWTVAGIMRKCARLGKKVVVLARPNPIGGKEIEGNVLEDDSRSFVGEYPIPMRHGMTIGEAALWMNQFGEIQADLEVVAMKGWKREMHWDETGRLWVMTSPNIPAADITEVYPGMVLLEGTNLSEGRGTTLPFRTIGAPYLKNLKSWLDELNRICTPGGASLRPFVFEPTFHKWARQTCWGIHVHVQEPSRVRPYQLGLGVLLASMRVAPGEFRYNDPPYEYERVRPPMQLLLGSSSMPDRLKKLAEVPLKKSVLKDLEEEWQPALREFRRQRSSVLLYR